MDRVEKPGSDLPLPAARGRLCFVLKGRGAIPSCCPMFPAAGLPERWAGALQPKPKELSSAKRGAT